MVPLPPGRQADEAQPGPDPGDEPANDPVLVAPWNHRGTVEAVVVLSGGARVKRRVFLSLTGPALTAPAHQWLIHEPEPLISGLSGRRISMQLVNQLTAMITELRKMDDVAGGGVLALAQQEFGWAADLLNRASYDETTGRALYCALADLGQFCGWSAYDAGEHGLAQRYNIAALRAASSADDRPQDRSACTEAISKARTQIEQLDSDDDPPWLYWVVPAWITAEAGTCLLKLGEADRAATMLQDGLALFDESFVRDQQLYTAWAQTVVATPGRSGQ